MTNEKATIFTPAEIAEFNAMTNGGKVFEFCRMSYIKREFLTEDVEAKDVDLSDIEEFLDKVEVDFTQKAFSSPHIVQYLIEIKAPSILKLVKDKGVFDKIGVDLDAMLSVAKTERDTYISYGFEEGSQLIKCVDQTIDILKGVA